MSNIFKNNSIFDYNNDGDTSLTEYIIGEKTIKESNERIENDIFDSELEDTLDLFKEDEEDIFSLKDEK